MPLQVCLRQALLLPLQVAMQSIPPQTVHHLSLRLLLQSTRGYLDTGLQLHAMSEAVVPVSEVELEVDQTLAARTISTSEASLGVGSISAALSVPRASPSGW